MSCFRTLITFALVRGLNIYFRTPVPKWQKDIPSLLAQLINDFLDINLSCTQCFLTLESGWNANATLF